MTSSPALHVLAFVGSDRAGSINAQLLDQTLAILDPIDEVTIDRVGATDHNFPLFSQNIEETTGIPDDVHALFERFTTANTVLIASPEYNGGYSPLYKNTIDWLTRIDMKFLSGKYLGLVSASPGPMASARALPQMRQQLENMRTTVHPELFGVGSAFDALSNEGPVEGLTEWVAGFSEAARAHHLG